jgi:hypothetical protein
MGHLSDGGGDGIASEIAVAEIDLPAVDLRIQHAVLLRMPPGDGIGVEEVDRCALALPPRVLGPVVDKKTAIETSPPPCSRSNEPELTNWVIHRTTRTPSACRSATICSKAG